MNTFNPHGFCKRHILVTEADLGDVAGLVPERPNEARVPTKRVSCTLFAGGASRLQFVKNATL